MTYFECISLLKNITSSNQDEILLTELNNADIVFYNDAKYRFAIHVIDTIKTKENKAFDKFLTIITTELVGFEIFSLETLNLKKELKYIEKIANSKIIPEECQNDVREVYGNIINSYNKFIEEILSEYYQEGFIEEYYGIMNRNEVK